MSVLTVRYLGDNTVGVFFHQYIPAFFGSFFFSLVSFDDGRNTSSSVWRGAGRYWLLHVSLLHIRAISPSAARRRSLPRATLPEGSGLGKGHFWRLPRASRTGLGSTWSVAVSGKRQRMTGYDTLCIYSSAKYATKPALYERVNRSMPVAECSILRFFFFLFLFPKFRIS